MSHSPDHAVSSGRVVSSAATSSIMGIEPVSPSPSALEIEERTALLDVERGPEYGSQSSSLPKANLSVEIQESSQVLHTISYLDTQL